MGAVLVPADLGQLAIDWLPPGWRDCQRDLADGHDVADGQFPGRFSRVADQTAPRWTSMNVVVSCHCHPAGWAGVICDHRWMLDSATGVKPDASVVGYGDVADLALTA